MPLRHSPQGDQLDQIFGGIEGTVGAGVGFITIGRVEAGGVATVVGAGVRTGTQAGTAGVEMHVSDSDKTP